MSHRIYKSQFWHERVKVLKNRGISPLTAIDIGANVGEWFDDFKQHFPNANVLSVEANPQLEAELKSKNPNTLITLLGEEISDEVEFYINPDTSNDVGASIYREATQWGNNSTTVKIPMTTLDSLNKKFDWIKMDVQGAELDVLMGGKQTLEHAMVVELELSVMKYNLGSPSASNVISWMWARGFELLDVTEHIYIEENEDGNHKLAQVNVLFLNDKYGHLLEVTG
jgi:FkbM family methyltransferase